MTTNTDLPGSGAPSHARLDADTFDALKSRTEDHVRRCPADSRKRWLLFELLCLDGAWERALRHLQTWATLRPDGESRAQTFRLLVQSEAFRAEVFAGRRLPCSLGPVPAWLDTLHRANAALADQDLATADALRTVALNDAPARGGDGQPLGAFAWLTDSDSRLGPVCELIATGCYHLLPFDDLSSLTLGPVTAPSDLIWRQATVTRNDGKVLHGYVPMRYPGSERGPTPVKLARHTTWTELGETSVIALGQKTWTTDHGDFGLLGLDTCRFDTRERA